MQYYMLVRNGNIISTHDHRVILYTEKEINLSDLSLSVIPVTIEMTYPDLGEMLIRVDNKTYYAVRKHNV